MASAQTSPQCGVRRGAEANGSIGSSRFFLVLFLSEPPSGSRMVGPAITSFATAADAPLPCHSILK